MAESHEQRGGRGDRDLDLTIRATNNDVWETDRFKLNDKVDKVRDKAVRHFVDQGSMSDDEYDLALVVDGVAQPPLNPDDHLRDAGIQDGSVLVLVPKRPQVDGQCTIIS